MSDIKVTLDIGGLSEYTQEFGQELIKDVYKGIEGLAAATHAHIVEGAQNELQSFRKQYLENLEPPKQIENGVWEIVLKSPAVWLDDGKDAWDMKGEPGSWGLLKKPTGHTKDGRAFKIIPMNQAQAPSELMSGRSTNGAGAQQNTINLLKSELKKRSIPYKKLEMESAVGRKTGNTIQRPITNADDRPLHKLDIRSGFPSQKANTPQLHGLNIYQIPSKKEGGGVSRTLTTFRTAIEGDDKWMHPSVEKIDLLGKAADWAQNEFEQKYLPMILEKYR